jgi:glutamine synthetase
MMESQAEISAEQALEAFQKLGARFLWLVYHDFAGLPRAKIVPGSRALEALSSGASFNKTNWDVDISGSLVPGSTTYGADEGDFHVVPDARSLVPVPYREGVAQVYAFLFDHDGEWAGDPRRRLVTQAEKLRRQGLRVRVGMEAELTLIDGLEDAARGRTDTRMFALSDIDARWGYWASVLDVLQAMGVSVHQLGREFGDRQYEVSLMPADPVEACDQMLTTRQVIKALATDRGWTASFMPKPWFDRPGCGLHVHLSFSDALGRDALTDRDDAAGMTPVARRLLAGLLRHARAQVALGSPSLNSFRRLRPGTWAPAHVTWGIDNRAVLVRIPGGPPSATRFEYRSGDFSANLYLHLAGLLAAAADGLDAGHDLPPSAPGAVLDWSDEEARGHGVELLPRSLGEALDALVADEILVAALGPVICEHYVAVKREELRTFSRETAGLDWPSGITEWETRTYLAAL